MKERVALPSVPGHALSMREVLESMVKPWWLSREVFISVLILLGLTTAGWAAFSWYVGEVFLSWLLDFV